MPEPPELPWPPPSPGPLQPSPAPEPSGAFRTPRRDWRRLVVVAALVAAASGGASAVGVAMVVKSSGTTIVDLSPNKSVFPRLHDVQNVLAGVLPAVVAIRATGPGCLGLLAGAVGQVDEGTGMFVSSTGEVLTNNHVVAGATRITVTMDGGRTAYPATLVGADPTYDVALLQIDGPRVVPVVRFASSGKVLVGDGVLAIGNALGLSLSTPSVTEGIISAEGRSIRAGGACEGVESLTGLLQTQAAINPGNSGGPLVDSSGQVIGMNTAAAASSAGNAPAQNIGFAIPVDSIKSLLEGLRRGGTIGPPKAFVGVDVVSVTPAERAAFGLTPRTGALVVNVIVGTPASAAGIRANDVIVAFDRRAVTNDAALSLAIGQAHPGEKVPVELYRGTRLLRIEITLATRPAPASS